MEMFLGDPNETKMVNAGHVMHDLPKSFLYKAFKNTPTVYSQHSVNTLHHV